MFAWHTLLAQAHTSETSLRGAIGWDIENKATEARKLGRRVKQLLTFSSGDQSRQVDTHGGEAKRGASSASVT